MRITQYRYLPPLLVYMHTTGSAGRYRKYLDAEDREFIDQVRMRGRVDHHSMSDLYSSNRLAIEDATGDWRYAEERCREADRSHSTFFDEEMLEYWENRWAFEDNMAAERRAVMEQEALERQARRDKLARDKEMAAGELAREELAWNKEQERLARERQKRLLQTMEADLEWERAKPDQDLDEEGTPIKTAEWWKDSQAADRVRDAPFSEQRHYVPEWKRPPKPEKKQKPKPEEKPPPPEPTQEEMVQRAVEHGRQRALQELPKREKNAEEWAAYHKRVALHEEMRWIGSHGRYVPLRQPKHKPNGGRHSGKSKEADRTNSK